MGPGSLLIEEVDLTTLILGFQKNQNLILITVKPTGTVKVTKHKTNF